MIDCQPTPIGSLGPAQTFMGFPFENQGSNKPPLVELQRPCWRVSSSYFIRTKERKQVRILGAYAAHYWWFMGTTCISPWMRFLCSLLLELPRLQCHQKRGPRGSIYAWIVTSKQSLGWWAVLDTECSPASTWLEHTLISLSLSLSTWITSTPCPKPCAWPSRPTSCSRA